MERMISLFLFLFSLVYFGGLYETIKMKCTFLMEVTVISNFNPWTIWTLLEYGGEVIELQYTVKEDLASFTMQTCFFLEIRTLKVVWCDSISRKEDEWHESLNKKMQWLGPSKAWHQKTITLHLEMVHFRHTNGAIVQPPPTPKQKIVSTTPHLPPEDVW